MELIYVTDLLNNAIIFSCSLNEGQINNKIKSAAPLFKSEILICTSLYKSSTISASPRELNYLQFYNKKNLLLQMQALVLS